jgi:DNA replication protein DnaC
MIYPSLKRKCCSLFRFQKKYLQADPEDDYPDTSSSFIYKSQNILFIGPPGVGKSHLAIGQGIAAIHNGYNVLHKSAFDLVAEMAEAETVRARKD